VVQSQPKHEASLPSSPPPASPYEHAVAAEGLVESSSENISIGTPLSDVVTEVAVSVGQAVKTGDPLFKLDDRQLRADLACRQADLEVARTQVKVNNALLEDVRRQLNFAETLADKRAMSSEELAKRQYAVEAAQARLEAAKSQVDAAAAQVKSTETHIERSVVRSPTDGEVLQVKVHAGEFAPAGVTATPLILLGTIETAAHSGRCGRARSLEGQSVSESDRNRSWQRESENTA